MGMEWMAVLLVGGCAGLTGFAAFLGWFRRPDPLISVEALCPELPPAGEEFPSIQWLGHSSYRIEWGGRVLLLDPVLARRVAVTPRRMSLPVEEVLHGVTDVLISHGHMDHLDNGTLRRIPPANLYFPERATVFLDAQVRSRHALMGFAREDILELGTLKVHVVSARHGGWRMPWQRGHFACGFVISDGAVSLYYAGDTAMGRHFNEIAGQHHPDISILPIGGYSPRWFLKSRHLNPPEAAEAAAILGSRWVIPSHFGTYRVSLEAMDEPLGWFRREMLNRQAD